MKEKIYKIIKILFMVLPIFISSYFIKVIKDLNMVPNKYFISLIIILLILNVLIILGLICKKIVFNVIGFILSIIVIIVSLYGIKHGNKIANFINKSFNNNNLEVTVASVVVLKNSNYNKLDDLNDKLMGYVTIDENKDKYSSLLKSKITVELKSYDNVFKLYDSLINKETDSIIINEAYLDLLQEEYSDINDKIKVIYNLEIESKLNNDSDKIKKLKPVNILISGSDSRSGQIVSKTRSDVNMIMTIDPKNHKILLTSIPRDYYVRLHGTSGNKDKLTHAGIYGINMTKETIEDLFDIKIDYTIKVGFKSVIDIVDYIGGIDIDSDKEFTTDSGDGGVIKTHIVKGNNHLSGPQALAFARERHAFKDGDNQRIQNQQIVLEAIIAKITKNKSLLKRYDELLELFSELYRTDIPSDFIKLIVKDQLNSMKSWKVEKQQVTGEGAKRETYSMPGRDLYVAIPDMDSVKEAREKILSIIDGD